MSAATRIRGVLRVFSFAAFIAALAGAPLTAARAQSETSAALSMLPLASIVGTASLAGAATGAASAAPVILSAAGAVFVVRAVELSARGTVYLLERASDGARVSVEIAGRGAGAASLGVGASVTVAVIGAGLVLSAAGELVAFLPNAIGQALLHDERLTR